MDSLFNLCLQRIARDPVACLGTESIKRCRKSVNYIKITDAVIATVTDAGKLSDSISLLIYEHPERRRLVIKNSKLSDIQIGKIVATSANLISLDISGVLQVHDLTGIYTKLLHSYYNTVYSS
jgi:hypothetical protein